MREERVLLGSAIVLAFFVLTYAGGHTFICWGPYWTWTYGYSFGWYYPWVIFIIGVLLLLVFLSAVSEKDPLDILKERYARGEISREEYLNIKSKLRR